MSECSRSVSYVFPVCSRYLSGRKGPALLGFADLFPLYLMFSKVAAGGSTSAQVRRPAWA